MLLTREDFRKMTPPEVRSLIEEKYVRYLDLAVSELDPSLPTVLAAHLTVQGAEMSGSEQTSLIAHEPKFTVGQLARPGIDYVALGHIHRYQDRNAGATPPIVYCGSIECISFKEWEDHKGFVLVDIDDDGSGTRQTRYTFVETRARPFIAVEVDLREAEDPTEAIVAAIGQQDVREAIVRIRYRINEAQAGHVDAQRIREALQTAYGTASIERVVDPVERRRRTVVTRESTLEEALRRYVAQHENLATIEEALVERALALDAEYEATQKKDA
jgi:exonuclease SbcD